MLCFWIVSLRLTVHLFFPTILPSFLPSQHQSPILIALLSPFKHFLAVETNNPDLFPVPQVFKQWRQTAILEAPAWEENLTNCFPLTIKLKSKSGPDKNKYY
ncbi:hypothetical protein VP01_2065g1 [Puccinia sorghi]|uniref:Uncharacterized protein n=1 Tax=Puccinia sorghi TaxID=27349 RepID=A0A0L6VAJ9_9BASI|nr:hypothetical protein VP01_2065g1 [Puccinia sorghi]